MIIFINEDNLLYFVDEGINYEFLLMNKCFFVKNIKFKNFCLSNWVGWNMLDWKIYCM